MSIMFVWFIIYSMYHSICLTTVAWTLANVYISAIFSSSTVTWTLVNVYISTIFSSSTVAWILINDYISAIFSSSTVAWTLVNVYISAIFSSSTVAWTLADVYTSAGQSGRVNQFSGRIFVNHNYSLLSFLCFNELQSSV